jgi:FAS-associated factor 2
VIIDLAFYTREERNFDRRLRDEQDRAYKESLAADREKERKRREEEDRIRREEEEAQRAVEEEEERERLRLEEEEVRFGSLYPGPHIRQAKMN